MTYVDRMKAEYKELADKLNKASAYLENNLEDKSKRSYWLLEIQVLAMADYATALHLRIKEAENEQGEQQVPEGS